MEVDPSDRCISVNGRMVPLNDLVGLECVFATYTQNKLIRSDVLVVKENVHFKDGTVEPNIRLIKDRKWPFYITREGFRNHNDKKEWEAISKLQKFPSTRINLNRTIAKALGHGMELPLRKLANSQYLYGADILPTSLIKHEYQKRFPDAQTTTFSVASLDTETDMETGKIIMTNVCFKNFAFTAVVRSFTNDDPNFIAKCKTAAMKLMGEEIKTKDLKWKITIVDTPGQSVAESIAYLHKWKPDFISIWNMDFDIPKMVDALRDDGYDPALVFSDPAVPDEYKFFNYQQGPAIKVTQDGSKISLHPAERWHVCTTPASFYFVDAMCLYKRIRTAAGNEPSYALDYILKKHNAGSKLKIDELASIEEDGDLWHTTMQRDYKPEYVVYNLRDDTALLDLDDIIGDISQAFNTLAGLSDYRNFIKQPRKIADDLHFFVLERGLVIATTPEDISKDPLNKIPIGLGGWIVALASNLYLNGDHFLEDAPNIQTLLSRYLAD